MKKEIKENVDDEDEEEVEDKKVSTRGDPICRFY